MVSSAEASLFSWLAKSPLLGRSYGFSEISRLIETAWSILIDYFLLIRNVILTLKLCKVTCKVIKPPQYNRQNRVQVIIFMTFYWFLIKIIKSNDGYCICASVCQANYRAMYIKFDVDRFRGGWSLMFQNRVFHWQGDAALTTALHYRADCRAVERVAKTKAF